MATSKSNGNISLANKLRKENATLSSTIYAAYRLHSEMQDKDARVICDALGITAATTKNRAARNELRLAILNRLPVVVDGATSVTPARLKCIDKARSIFAAAVIDWPAAIIEAANNKPDESGAYKQVKVKLNDISWVEDGGKETCNVDRTSTKIYCYDSKGSDITAANAAFVNGYIRELEINRVANRAGSNRRAEVKAQLTAADSNAAAAEEE